MFQIEILHNFETAHRLSAPGSPPKCMSIHGHSWWVRVDIAGPRIDEAGILVEFGAFKRAWRGWLDNHIDHHLVLAEGDPMGDAVRAVYPQSRILCLPMSPTTEALASYLYGRAVDVLEEVRPAEVDARVVCVHLQETRTNAASYRSSVR